MEIEYEATFPNINKEQIRQKLKQVGANLIKPEFLQKRVVFDFPKGHEIKGGWLRVRDESDRIVVTLKLIDGDKIEDVKEINLKVDDYDNAIELFDMLGCERKAFQESRREIWKLEGAEICLDEWPFLEPFVEVEAKSEEVVKLVSERLGFNYSEAVFGAVDILYANKYGITKKQINEQTPEIIFEGKNPFE